MRVGRSRSAQQPSFSLLNNRHAESPSSFRIPVGRSLHCLPEIDLKKMFKKFNPLNLFKTKPKALKRIEKTKTPDKYTQLTFTGAQNMVESDPRQPKLPTWEIPAHLVPRRVSSLQVICDSHIHSSAATETYKQSGVDFFKRFFSGMTPPHQETTELTVSTIQATSESLPGRHHISDETDRVFETYLENPQMCEHCYGRFQSKSTFLSSSEVLPQQQPQPQQQRLKSELELVYEKLDELNHALSQLNLRKCSNDDGDKEIIDDEHIDNLFDMICHRVTPSGYIEVTKEAGLEAVNLYLALQQVALSDYEYGRDHQMDAGSGSGSGLEKVYGASANASLTTLTFETHARIGQLLMLES